jgi:hypothetical protein
MSKIPTANSLASAVARHHKQPLHRLREAVQVADELNSTGDALIDHFVDEARTAGHSWTEIGEVLGMTKQAAQQRFRTRWLDRFTRGRKFSTSSCMTDRARLAVEAAADESRHMKHNYIGTEHLLLGLLRDRTSLAYKALASLGVTLPQIQKMLKEEIGGGQQPVPQSIPFTPRAKEVLDMAIKESRQLGHNYLGTEHILLALSALDDGLASRFLTASGVRYEDIKRLLVSLLTNRAS